MPQKIYFLLFSAIFGRKCFEPNYNGTIYSGIYTGTINVARYGTKCQNWNSNYPHKIRDEFWRKTVTSLLRNRTAEENRTNHPELHAYFSFEPGKTGTGKKGGFSTGTARKFSGWIGKTARIFTFRFSG